MEDLLTEIQHIFNFTKISPLLPVGIIIVTSFIASELLKKTKLPSILIYMITGIVIGPSVTGIAGEEFLGNADFLTRAILAFIGFKIGMEINFSEIKERGKEIALTTLLEALTACGLVTAGVYLLTRNLPLSLLMGSLAPASAPAGTTAVIEEYKAEGKLTNTLFAVVGIDDGLGILIFGLVSPVAVSLISSRSNGLADINILLSLLEPLKEIALSIFLGTAAGAFFIMISKEEVSMKRVLIITFGSIILLSGICRMLNVSIILANMCMGIIIGNDNKHRFLRELEEKDFGVILPLFFLLFFTIAGANLHLSMLPGAGLTGAVYILCRFSGKFAGAYIGSSLSGFEKSIRNNLGFGILSQAGVAIGLSLILKHELAGTGPIFNKGITVGDHIGRTIFTTITATTVVFELAGPLFTKFALKRAGEIKE